MSNTKQCNKCKKELPLTIEFFHRDKNGKYGFKSVCKICSKIYCDKNREKRRENGQIWYQKNREHKLQKSRIVYRKKHPEKPLKIYWNYNWLYDQYITKRKTTTEIARECNITENMISYWLKKFNIPTRKMSEYHEDKPYKHKDWLYHQYIELDRLGTEIAKDFNVDPSTIYSRLHQFNIKKDEEGQKRAREKYTLSGEKHPCWKGGRCYDGQGYVYIYSPNHPNAIGNYVYEHRLIMESFLKEYLKPEEVVHHINGIRDDNRLSNLILYKNNSEHLINHYKNLNHA